MQMGVEEKPDIASGRCPAPSFEVAASHAPHKHGLTLMWQDNLVVEETSIGYGNILTSDLMRLCYSGMDMAEMKGRHCENGSVDCL
jgi:hypothetical protein